MGICESDKVHVTVLLATFNGQEFLDELLKSLTAQIGVTIHLIVGDDGSTDKTVEILHSWAEQFASFQLYNFQRIGPANNFMTLLRYTESNFIAFADQDDIWIENHLIQSIRRLSPHGQIPSLSFSSTKTFGTGIKSEVWPGSLGEPNIKYSCFQNQARGCTIVINGQAKKLITLNIPKNLVMHDWWMLLVVMTCGKIVYSPEYEVYYRLHKNNHIGVNKRHGAVFLKTLKSGRWAPFDQLAELHQYYKNYFVNDPENFIELALLSRTKFFLRLRLLILSKSRFRGDFLNEVKFRFGIIFLRLLTRNIS